LKIEDLSAYKTADDYRSTKRTRIDRQKIISIQKLPMIDR